MSSPTFHPGRQLHLNSVWQFPHHRPPLPKRPYLTHHPQRATSSIWETILPHGLTKTQTGNVYPLLIKNRRRKRLIRTTCLHCANYTHTSAPIPRSSPPTSQSNKSAVSRSVHERKDANLRWIISQETFWSPQSPCAQSLRKPCSRFLICV